MMNILTLKTGHLYLPEAFLRELKLCGCRTTDCDSLNSFRQRLAELQDVAAVIAHQDDLALVKELIRERPTLDYAMLSPLDPQAFHEATEGFGIFMQLPASPTAEHGREMLARLAQLRAAESATEGEAA